MSLIQGLRFLKALYTVRGPLCKSNAATADLGRAAGLHLAEGLWEIEMLQTKCCFSFFKSFTVLISTDSDSALALVYRKVKT